MQQRHDNKIESHNHNEHLLLYKEAKIFLSSLGRFLECRKWNILVIVLCLIYMHSPLGARPQASCIYIRQSTPACVITYTCIRTQPGHSPLQYTTNKYSTLLAKQKHLGCKKSVRPIRSSIANRCDQKL